MDGVTWSTVQRVPIDPVTSTVDHFIPGIGVDKGTSGGSAHIGVAYYYYPVAACNSGTCQLTAGFISSTDGGATWSTAHQVSRHMTLSWIASTNQGRMVGDYVSVSFAGGTAHPAYSIAKPPISGVYAQQLATATFDITGPRLSGPVRAGRSKVVYHGRSHTTSKAHARRF